MRLPPSEDVIASQIAYYRAHAPKYDDWWLRRGRHDRGEEFRSSWDAQIETLLEALKALAPLGDVLELAGGTGNWTRELAALSDSVTVVDAAPEAVKIAREKVRSRNVRWHLGDVFQYNPDRLHDTVFFSFWLSHVPPDRFERFWDLVDRCLMPGGRVFFIDNAHPEAAVASAPELLNSNVWLEGTSVRGTDSVTDLETGIARRVAADGRDYEIVKIWWDPEQLRARLARLGWDARPNTTQWAFIYGTVTRAPKPPVDDPDGNEVEVIAPA